jgi:hypothetical protein
MGFIAVRFLVRWQSPVLVEEGPLSSGIIAGPAKALRHMKTFQHKSSPNDRRAVDLCQRVLTDGVHPEICRLHFIAAGQRQFPAGSGSIKTNSCSDFHGPTFRHKYRDFTSLACEYSSSASKRNEII